MLDALVFIGRFRPYHPGHHHVALEALNKAKKLIFVIGSDQEPRSVRNPYTSEEVAGMIMAAFEDPDERSRLRMVYQEDHRYNEKKWLRDIQIKVNMVLGWSAQPHKIGLIGYSKDHSSYYLKKFPFWGENSINVEPKCHLSATDYRQKFFNLGSAIDYSTFYINAHHKEYVLKANEAAIKAGLVEEYNFINKYRAAWAQSPYPPFFQCVDAVCTQSGHVLLVVRKTAPGRGLWALPGGHVGEFETLADATLRELGEETLLNIPPRILTSSIRKIKTYDNPYRSPRGRVITQATHFDLPDRKSLEKVQGADDAKEAFWISLEEFSRSRQFMFEDHYDIVEDMLEL